MRVKPKRQRGSQVSIGLLVASVMVCDVSADVRSSSSYSVITETLDGGGGFSSGASYSLSGSIAPFVAGSSTSATYTVDHGYTPEIVSVAVLVEGRWIFYNESSWDGDSAALNSDDDAAIASDKSALFLGDLATFSNYTSYTKGINGIMVDVLNLPGTPDSSDFGFRVGNSDSVASWSEAPAPAAIAVRLGAGANGADRVSIRWENNVIEKQWLEVTVKATDQTGLLEADVFYFGNAIGETGNVVGNTFVNISDENGARQNPRNFLNKAPIDDAFDFNRDGFVNISDENKARQNGTNFLTDLVMLDLAEAPVVRGVRASIETTQEFGQPRPQVSIRRTGRESEFVVETILTSGHDFELQFRGSAEVGEWQLVEGAILGADRRSKSWFVSSDQSVGIFRLVPIGSPSHRETPFLE